MPHKRKHSCGQLIPTDVMLLSTKFLCEVEKRTSPSALGLKMKYLVSVIPCPHLRLPILLRHYTVIAALKFLHANNDCTACSSTANQCTAALNYKTMVPFSSWVRFYKTILGGDSSLGDFHDCPGRRLGVRVPEQ